jgi:hypothetical protein
MAATPAPVQLWDRRYTIPLELIRQQLAENFSAA